MVPASHLVTFDQACAIIETLQRAQVHGDADPVIQGLMRSAALYSAPPGWMLAIIVRWPWLAFLNHDEPRALVGRINIFKSSEQSWNLISPPSLHRLLPCNERGRIMTYSPNFPSRHLTQIVRVVIAKDSSGLLVARSADLPGRAAFATDIASLAPAIHDVIERYFADRDERIHVRRSPGRPLNDLSTWEVDTIEAHEQVWAAE